MNRPWIALALFAASSTSCGAEEVPLVIARWRQSIGPDLAPPGRGPEDRIIVGRSGRLAEWQTLVESTGAKLEGPFATSPTTHGAVAVGSHVFFVSSLGQISAADLAGAQRFGPLPESPLGRTGPLAVATDGSLRVVGNSGGRGRMFAANESGETIFDVAFDGISDSRPAIADDGTAFVATDDGQLIGFDVKGARAFRQSVNAPASGPSVGEIGIAVGEVDGVRLFDREGKELFRHERAARVVGTRVTSDGNVMAWGEDGVFEVLDATGNVELAYTAGPPIQAEVLAVDARHFAILDSEGTVHLIDDSGKSIAELDLGGTPNPEIVESQTMKLLVCALGEEMVAIDFFVP